MPFDLNALLQMLGVGGAAGVGGPMTGTSSLAPLPTGVQGGAAAPGGGNLPMILGGGLPGVGGPSQGLPVSAGPPPGLAGMLGGQGGGPSGLAGMLGQIPQSLLQAGGAVLGASSPPGSFGRAVAQGAPAFAEGQQLDWANQAMTRQQAMEQMQAENLAKIGRILQSAGQAPGASPSGGNLGAPMTAPGPASMPTATTAMQPPRVPIAGRLPEQNPFIAMMLRRRMA